MYKNEQMYIAKMEENPLQNIMRFFYNGADIVYVTVKNCFWGGVTKGDIQRHYSNEPENIQLEVLVNTQMRSIVFYNEDQVFSEAQNIFDNNWRIKNIPVIDKSGRLLFQVDHFITEYDKDLLEARRNGSLELFLQSDEVKKIILTGANLVSLNICKKIIDTYCKSIELQKITIEIKENVQDCCNLDKKVKVICLSEGGILYLNRISEYTVNAISLKDLITFNEFSKLEKYDRSIIDTWKTIFGYTKVFFISNNEQLIRLENEMKNAGIQVCGKDSLSVSNNVNLQFLSSFDVLLFSEGKRKYCEKIKVMSLIKIFDLIWRYKQITGNDLTVQQYTNSGIQCLKGLHSEGYDGVLYQINNIWEEKFGDKIKEVSDLQVIHSDEDMRPEINYIIDPVFLKKLTPNSYLCALKEYFFLYACEYAVYSMVKSLCRNVFLYPAQYHMHEKFSLYIERTRYNFLHKKEYFPIDFVNTICGDANYPLDSVIQDMEDCQTVKINNGYVKFLSNYRSKYFNTDIYGNRIVKDVPLDYLRTIWLVGACNFAGYAVEDQHTPASLLQKKINESGYPYRVVDLSCEGVSSTDLYNKIMEQDITMDDIVIILEHTLILKEKEVGIDFKEIDNTLNHKIWYWDSVGHPGLNGYKEMTVKIFNSIKPKMIKEKKKYTFELEEKLKHQVQNFIVKLKNELNQNKFYQQIFYNANKECKRGAIVMNCNPFTYGHQYLIETASRLVDILFIFVVEENKSVFPFEERFCMVKEGAANYKNAIVVPSGEFMISTITFPGYFLKEAPTKECYDTFLDLKIFAHYIAPAFKINVRIVGEEPSDPVTAQYNHDMKVILRHEGVDVIEIPRKRYGDEIISASRVRKLLETKQFDVLKKYVPQSTLKYLIDK